MKSRGFLRPVQKERRTRRHATVPSVTTWRFFNLFAAMVGSRGGWSRRRELLSPKRQIRPVERRLRVRLGRAREPREPRGHRVTDRPTDQKRPGQPRLIGDDEREFSVPRCPRRRPRRRRATVRSLAAVCTLAIPVVAHEDERRSRAVVNAATVAMTSSTAVSKFGRGAPWFGSARRRAVARRGTATHRWPASLRCAI